MTVERLRPLTLINAALTLVCAVLALLVLLSLFRQPEVEETDLQVASSPRRLMAWNWFPVSLVSPVLPAQETAEDYEEINIRAELLGVIIAPGGSHATIRISGQERVFRPGDEIESGIEVSRIEPTRVVVTQRGRTLQLSFPEQGQRAEVTRSRSASIKSSGTSVPMQAIQLPNVLSAEPVDVDGYNAGYRLSSVSSDIRGQADIRDGDIVVKVGDLDLQALMANPAQWVNLSTETTLPVTVVRDGREETVYVNALALSARLLPNLNSN